MTKRILANRRNSNKSTGPENTTSTRYNATKHGLLAVGLTELDDVEGYRDTLRDLEKEKQPVGAVEIFLVKSAALEIVRLQRARKLEAEYITCRLNPPIHGAAPLADLSSFDQGPLIDPGLPETMHHNDVQLLVSIYQRYESTITLRLFRTLHELERLQRMRQGEQVSAPTAVDVTVGVDRCEVDQPSTKKDVIEGYFSSQPPKMEEVDSGNASEKDEEVNGPRDN